MRECTNQVLEYDLESGTIEVCKTKGVSIGARKNHSAAVYKGSMIIYGGQTENGMVAQDMIVFHMDTHEWVKIQLKSNSPQHMQAFVQGTVCAVIPPKQTTSKDSIRTRKVSRSIFKFEFRAMLSKMAFITSVASQLMEN